MNDEPVPSDSSPNCPDPNDLHDSNSRRRKNQQHVYLNCRGKKVIVRRDTLECFPFFQSYLSTTWDDNPCDDDGNYIVDESAEFIFHLVDLYRCWLELGSPIAFDDISLSSKIVRRGLLASVARRLGCEETFIHAILNRNAQDESKLYKCYYCKLIFMEGESAAMKECLYHRHGCRCKDRSRNSLYTKCGRLPYHSATKLDIAEDPCDD